MGAGFCKELLHGLGSLDDIAFLRKRTKLSASCRKCQSAGSGQLIFSRNQAGLPRYAHSERKAGVGAERNALLALLAEYVIHAYEEVIALGMDVEHPSETRREAVHREVYTTIEPLQRLIVGT